MAWSWFKKLFPKKIRVTVDDVTGAQTALEKAGGVLETLKTDLSDGHLSITEVFQLLLLILGLLHIVKDGNVEE